MSDTFDYEAAYKTIVEQQIAAQQNWRPPAGLGGLFDVQITPSRHVFALCDFWREVRERFGLRNPGGVL